MKKIVYVKKSILDWAIKESELPVDFIIAKKPFLAEALDGKPITFKQLINLSSFLRIPVGYFFYVNPPATTKIAADFRTIQNKKQTTFSKNLKDVLLDMDYKKNWMSDYRRDNGYDRVEINNCVDLDENFDINIEKIRNILQIEVEWYRHCDNSASTFDFLKRKIEQLGILVMESSVVGNNQKRKIEISDFRGFALADEYSPLIFINNNDKEEARCFTLLHEFLHLLNNDSDDIFINLDNQIERKINNYVAELMMPSIILNEKINFYEQITKNEVRKLSVYFKVSLHAMTVHLFKKDFIDRNLYESILDDINNFVKKSGGGNYYATLDLKTSRTFSNAVFESVYSNKITFNEGYRLLGVKGNTFDVFGGKTYARY